MGDEKTHGQPGGKKQDEPPAPVHRQAQAQPEQKTGPGRASEQRPAASPAGQTAALQQSVGNQRTNRIMRAGRQPGQEPRAAGVPVSHPQDAAEKEAEAVAKKITGEQPAHPRDHPGPAPGDPVKVAGDPTIVHGDPDVVHRAPAAAGHPAPPSPSAASILDHPGAGDPIPQPIRRTLESRLKADLRHVVVHHDARADTAVRALHARAVTRGNHIWLASDASPYDLSLMAHEITHVLHHNDHTVHRQATGTGTDAPPPGKYYSGTEGTVDVEPTAAPGDTSPRKTIEIPEVPYAEKQKLSADPIAERFQQTRREVTKRPSKTKQVTIWRDKAKESPETRTKIEELVQKGTTRLPPPSDPGSTAAGGTSGTVDPSALYLLQYSPSGPTASGTGGTRTHQGVIIGTIEQLTQTAQRPNWDESGNFHTFDVDHLLELQVSGEDDFPNYWLWDSVANQSAGSALEQAISERVDKLLTAARKDPKHRDKPPEAPATMDSVDRSAWRIRVGKLGEGLRIIGTPDKFWTRKQVSEGAPVKSLHTVDTARAKELGLYPGGAKDYLVIIVGKAGGALVRVPWAEGQKNAKGKELAGVFDTVLPYFKITDVTYDPATNKGSLTGKASNKKDLIDPKEIQLPLSGFGPRTGAMRVARLDGYGLAQQAGFFHFKPLSDITITEAEIQPYTGLYVRGVLQPSIPLLKDTSIDVVLAGGDISLEKTFGAKDIGAVGPVKITEGAVTISVGTRGLEVGGTLELALGTLATGSLSASIDSQFNFGLEGRINFDNTLFKPATLNFYYRKLGADYQWGGGGLLGIPPDKVPGIQQATIQASYQNGTFTAAGSAKLSVPGLESGSLAITYGEREGVSIGGTFALAPNPVIASGSVSATISKRPPANRWQLSAQGTVKPKIPGVDATLTATYEDGVFTVEGQLAYARGMLAGSILIGLTNRPVDPQGRPAGTPHAGGPLRPYGGGTLTVRIAPWLQGTVGVQLQPDGSVQLMGEVALPESITLFDPLEVRKTLFTIGVDIPILGVAVAGQRIGIFATIQGGLEASAGVGPGQLRQLGLKVRYNPEHEEQTAITGGGQLYIPAHAGVRLFVRGALGAGIPIVSAEAGLEIGGQLGIEGAVRAGVTVNWTPKQGLVIDAEASVSAEPKFRFDINGYVKVSADLLITTVSLYEKKWQLAAFEYGSGLRVGIRAPIHYEQGKPFTFSLSDVQFEVPPVDPKQILADLVQKIA
jgi:hypothetical protein